MKTIRMQNPPHPGEILRELCLVPLRISVSASPITSGSQYRIRHVRDRRPIARPSCTSPGFKIGYGKYASKTGDIANRMLANDRISSVLTYITREKPIHVRTRVVRAPRSEGRERS